VIIKVYESTDPDIDIRYFVGYYDVSVPIKGSGVILTTARQGRSRRSRCRFG
jgi:hypothetical protein